MIRRLLRAGGEFAVYGFVAGVGLALIYMAVLMVVLGSPAMVVGALLLGVAALVLFAAVLRIARAAPDDGEALPPVIEQSMARPRPRLPRRHVTPAHTTQLPMPLRRPEPDTETTAVIPRVDDVVTTVPIRGAR